MLWIFDTDGSAMFCNHELHERHEKDWSDHDITRWAASYMRSEGCRGYIALEIMRGGKDIAAIGLGVHGGQQVFDCGIDLRRVIGGQYFLGVEPAVESDMHPVGVFQSLGGHALRLRLNRVQNAHPDLEQVGDESKMAPQEWWR